MSKATITIYDICARGTIAPSKYQLLLNGRNNIFGRLSTLPRYSFYTNNEEVRADFETQFLQHFMWDEIGQETLDRFLFMLQARLDTIMPFYAKLWETMNYEYDPIFNANYTREIYAEGEGSATGKAHGRYSGDVDSNSTTKSSGATEGTSESEAHNRQLDISNTTPMGGVNGVFDESGDIKWNNQMYMDGYATDRQNNTASAKTTGQSTDKTESSGKQTSYGTNDSDSESESKNKNHSIEHLEGNYGQVSTQDLIEKERALIRNINMEIFEECEDLFMQVL